MSYESYQCTIVTAYYDFPYKKHSSNLYSTWIKRFFSNIKANIVVFTDEKSSNVLKNVIEDMNNIRIIIFPISQFYTARFFSYWQKDFQRDHERYHNPNLYMVWNEKTMFIQRAMKMNLFNTEYYAWTDIGIMRDDKHIPYISNYPNPTIIQTLKKDKVYLLNIDDFTEDDLRETEATERFMKCNRIGAGVIFGHKTILEKWTHFYYDMLNDFMSNDFFTGKEQSIMACVYLKHRESLIELIKPIESPIDPWFYMLYYLGNRESVS